MAVDLRQVMGAFLTFSMFIMLGNMIKKDHIDPFLQSLTTVVVFTGEQSEPLPASPIVKYTKISRPEEHRQLIEVNIDPWMDTIEPAKPCWKKPSSKGKVHSNGYIFFSLTQGPEFHAIQVANAVAVARQLGATLAIPDIRGTKVGGKRIFGEIYDVDRFVTSLNGVVQVDKNPPAELSNGMLPIVRIPNRVTNDFISSKIEPIFQKTRGLKIFTNSNGTTTYLRRKEKKLTNDYECVAMYESLKLQTELQELVGSMVGTLRSLSQKTQGRFVAVDLKVDVLEKKFCRESDRVSKRCYNAEEIGEFLKRIGFRKETTIYLTQTGWQNSLHGLRNFFSNTFTKDAIMPADLKAKFMMNEESQKYEKYIDFYMCTQGDVFVPAYPSRFYASVVGKRIADGSTKVLLPAKNISASASATNYTSPYIAKRNHFAYSCFC